MYWLQSLRTGLLCRSRSGERHRRFDRNRQRACGAQGVCSASWGYVRASAMPAL
ncbi:hypothetical protein P5G60_08205 [Paenibacillus jamilae]|nr:hypothetical protein [Paenibacillus jamilae]